MTGDASPQTTTNQQSRPVTVKQKPSLKGEPQRAHSWNGDRSALKRRRKRSVQAASWQPDRHSEQQQWRQEQQQQQQQEAQVQLRPHVEKCANTGESRELSECRLRVEKATLERLESLASEISKQRKAEEQAGESAAVELEQRRAEGADILQHFRAALTTGKKTLGEAAAALNDSRSRLQQNVDDVETAVRAMETEIVAAEHAAKQAQLTLSVSGFHIDHASVETQQSSLLEAAEVALAEAKCCLEKNGERLSRANAERMAVLEKLAALSAGSTSALGASVLDLEKRLDAEHKVTEDLQARAAVVGAAYQKTCAVALLPVRQPVRLLAVTPALPEAAGEYRLMTSKVADRPAYAQRRLNGDGHPCTYLFWLMLAGRLCCWVFCRRLPEQFTEGGHIGKETNSNSFNAWREENLIAHSLQPAWTALPDELSSSQWKAGEEVVAITLIGLGA